MKMKQIFSFFMDAIETLLGKTCSGIYNANILLNGAAKGYLIDLNQVWIKPVISLSGWKFSKHQTWNYF